MNMGAMDEHTSTACLCMKGKDMKDKGTSQTKHRSIWKTIAAIAAVLVVLLILIILLVPYYISSASGTNMILGKINSSITGKVQVSDLSMGWLSGIKLKNVKFNDNAGAMEFTAKTVSTDPVYSSMLGGQMEFGKTVVDSPVVHVDLAKLEQQGPPEAKEEPAQERAEKPGPRPQGPSRLPVKRMDFVLNDGSVNITDSSGKRPSVQLAGINTLLNLRPIGEQTTFKINLVAANNPINANGTVTPSEEHGWKLVGTSGDFNIDINNLNLASLESVMAMVDPNIAASGIITAKGNVKLNEGQFDNIQLRVNGSNIKIKMPALKGDTFATSKLIANVNAAAAANTFDIQNFELQTDWANAALKGVLPKSFKNFAELMSPQSPAQVQGGANIDLAKLAMQLPNTLGLKPGTKINSGMVKAQITTQTRESGKVFTANANLASLQGVVGGKPAAISQPITIDAQIAADKSGAFVIDQFKASSSFVNANVSGTMEAIKYTLDGDLAKMQSELGQFVDFAGYKFAGKINASGNVGLINNILTSAGQANLGQLTVTNPKGASASEQTAQLKYNIKVDQKTNVLTIPAFSAVTSFADVQVSNATIPLNEKSDESANMVVNAKADLGKAMPWMIAFGGLSQDTQIGGIFSSKLNLTSKGTEYHIVTEDTKISNLSIVSPGKQPFTQSQLTVIADVFVDPSVKTYRVKDMKITSPAINITLSKFSQTTDKNTSKLQGTINAQYDLAAVSAMASPFMPSGLAVTGSRKDTITFSSQWPSDKPDLMMANMNANLGFGWQSAEYMGLEFGPAEMELAIVNGKMDIAPFTCKVNEGTLNFAATADFRKKPTLLRTPAPMQILKDVQINDKIAAVLLKQVNPIFAKAQGTQGTAQLQCKTFVIPIAGGSPNDTQIEATTEIQNLKLNSPILNGIVKAISMLRKTQSTDTTMYLHPTTFVLNNGVLTYNNMQIDIGDLPTFFSGRLGLDNSLKASIVLPITTRGQVVTTGQTGVSGTTLAFKGTVDNPELDLATIIRSIAQQEIQDRLLGGLKKEGTTQPTQPGTQQPTSPEDAGRKLLEEGLQNILGGSKKK